MRVIPYRSPIVRSRPPSGFLMRPSSINERPSDLPVRVCAACGYDVRGSLAAGRCPECGEELAPGFDDGTAMADESGLDLVAGSMLASLPALGGLVLLGLVGRILAIVAVVAMGFRVAGLVRFRNGRVRSALPSPFERLLWITTGVEATIAIAATVISVIPLGLPSPRLWSIAGLGAWSVVAGLGLAAIALGLRGIARRLETEWASAAGAIAAGLCLLATVISIGLATVSFWIASGTAPPAPIPGLLALGMIILGPLAALVGILLVRMLLLSVESHALSTVIDALRPRRDPRREIGVPTAPLDTDSIEIDPLPLEPERPPVRKDL